MNMDMNKRDIPALNSKNSFEVSLDEPLYYMIDLIDQAIVFPMHGYWAFCSMVFTLLKWGVVSAHYYTTVIDAHVTPVLVDLTRSLGLPVSEPVPLWYKPGIVVRDYHNYSHDYNYQFYPTYELGRCFALNWHLTFDPSRLGPLGMNMAEPRSAYPAIVCVGTDFVGEVKGSLHFGLKINGNGFGIDSIGIDGIRFDNPSSSPKLGIWLQLEFGEVTPAPGPRGPIRLQDLY